MSQRRELVSTVATGMTHDLANVVQVMTSTAELLDDEALGSDGVRPAHTKSPSAKSAKIPPSGPHAGARTLTGQSACTPAAILTISAAPDVNTPQGTHPLRFDVASPGATNTPYTFYSISVTVTPGPVWSQAAPMPTPRYGTAVVALGNTIYAIGGNASAASPYPGGPTVSVVEALDVATNQWSTKASLPMALEYSTVAVHTTSRRRPGVRAFLTGRPAGYACRDKIGDQLLELAVLVLELLHPPQFGRRANRIATNQPRIGHLQDPIIYRRKERVYGEASYFCDELKSSFSVLRDPIDRKCRSKKSSTRSDR